MATSQQVWYAEATAHYIQYYKNNYGADVLVPWGTIEVLEQWAVLLHTNEHTR